MEQLRRHVTPWNTGLTAEEYEPFATWMIGRTTWPMTDYLGEQANPYHYGYLVELTPTRTATAWNHRREALRDGSLQPRERVVMPDLKTVYHGDDGTDVVFFKFVADEPGPERRHPVRGQGHSERRWQLRLRVDRTRQGRRREIAEAIRTLELP